eukprot:1932740-Amphidinium_carterae.1
MMLSYAWLVCALLGPSLPLLNVLTVLLAKIYSVLLFGSHFQLLKADESQQPRAALWEYVYSRSESVCAISPFRITI